jgi:hypothetical protein
VPLLVPHERRLDPRQSATNSSTLVAGCATNNCSQPVPGSTGRAPPTIVDYEEVPSSEWLPYLAARPLVSVDLEDEVTVGRPDRAQASNPPTRSVAFARPNWRSEAAARLDA